MNLKTIAALLVFICFSFAFSDGIFLDKRDGKQYRTVKMGHFSWLAENLNYKTKGSFCYFNNEAYCQEYGRLYDIDAATKACPRGTHLSTNQEWEIIQENIVGSEKKKKKMKTSYGWHLDEIGINHCRRAEEWANEGDRKEYYGWEPEYHCSHDGNGTDDFGFSVVPAGTGIRENGRWIFMGVGSEARFWAKSDALGKRGKFIRIIDGNSDKFYSGGSSMGALNRLASIRCVVDY